MLRNFLKLSFHDLLI
jgi:hypothetical protein